MKKRSRLGREICSGVLQRRSMEVDVFPNAVDSLPNASFLGSRRDDVAASVRRLNQTDIRDHGGITHDADVRAADRDRWPFARSGRGARRIGEVGAMERQSLDQVPAAFGLDGRDIVRTDFDVSRPVTTENCGQQFFGRGKDFSGGGGGLRHRFGLGLSGAGPWLA